MPRTTHPMDPDHDPTAPDDAPSEALPFDAPAVIGPGLPKLGFSTSPDVSELFGALAKAQGKIGNAEKSATNPAFKKGNEEGRPYATLADCWNACRAALSENNLAVAQPPAIDGGDLIVITVLGHASGQWMRCAIALPTDLKPQNVGSAITYARRYGLCALVGIAPDVDDDGDAATRGAEGAAARKEERAQRVRATAETNASPQRRSAMAQWARYQKMAAQRDGFAPVIEDISLVELGEAREPETPEEWGRVGAAILRKIEEIAPAKKGTNT